MKKLRQCIIVTAVFIVLISCGYTVHADNIELHQYNGYYYDKFYDETGKLCANINGLYTKKLSDTLTIPEYIGESNYPVVGLYLLFPEKYVSGIKTLNIPASCISRNFQIYSNYNDGFNNLININIIGESKNYTSVDGVLYNKDMTELVYLPKGRTGTYVMPDSVVSLRKRDIVGEQTESIWAYCKITELITNDNIETISYGYYYDNLIVMNNLKKIYIGNNIYFGPRVPYFTEGKSINNVFSNCTKLSYIDVGSKNSNYSSYNGIVYSKDGTVLIYCPKGREGVLYIKPNTQQIKDCAFGGNYSVPVVIDYLPCNTKISDVYIPSSVADISDDAFSGCEGTITIHSTTDSYAHTYATEHGINWVEAEPSVTAEYADGKVTADVEYLPINSKKKLYIAVYNTRNQLVKYSTQNVPDGEYSFDVSDIPDAFRVKAMLWDDNNTLTPLCPASTAYVR